MQTEIKRASKLAVFCYGIGDLAGQFVWTFIGAYLTIFYTDIVGLAPAAISTIMMVARIWNSVDAPIFGHIAERSKFKMGRFRPFITFTSPILGLFLVLTFTHPFGGTTTAGVIWAAATYIICGTLYSVVGASYDAIIGVMTEDGTQIPTIGTARVVGMYVGQFIVNGLTVVIALRFSAPGVTAADGNGYFMAALVYGIALIPIYIAVGVNCKEVVRPQAKAEKSELSFVRSMALCFKNKYLLLYFLMQAMQMTVMTIRSAFVPYYATYCLNNYEIQAVILTAPTFVSIFSSLAAPGFAKRFGKKRVLIVALCVQITGYFIMFLNMNGPIALVIAGALLTGVDATGRASGLQADAVDHLEYSTGVRCDGVAFSLGGLGRGLAGALVSSVGVMLLYAMGYVAGGVQSAGTVAGINGMVTLLPIVSCGLGILFYLLWDLDDERAQQIRVELKERHAEAETA